MEPATPTTASTAANAFPVANTAVGRLSDRLPFPVLPRNLRPLILWGPSILEKDILLRKLWEIFPDYFTIAAFHTTDSLSEGQVSSDAQYCITPIEFANMVSNGEFVMHHAYGDFSTGVTKQTIAAGTAAQRVVVMEPDIRGVRQLKAVPGFDARYVFLTPPSVHVTEARLGQGFSETDEVKVHEPLKRILTEIGYTRDLEGERAELEYVRATGISDLIINSDNLEEALRSLVAFIHGSNH